MRSEQTGLMTGVIRHEVRDLLELEEPIPGIRPNPTFEPASQLQVLIPHSLFTRLQFLFVPKSVSMISEKCFKDCVSLRNVTFERNRTIPLTIGAEAFAGSGLMHIEIPSSVECLSVKCFYKCSSLTSISFEANCRLKRIDNFAFSESGLLTMYIPASVEFIADHCFFRCRNLESIVFEANSQLKQIRANTFTESGLSYINVPSSVEVICNESFAECRKLRSISFEPDSRLTQIEENAFIYNQNLTHFAIPVGINQAFHIIFSCCPSLKHITFDPRTSITTLENSAFWGLSIVHIKIPASVEHIGKLCFGTCFQLKTVIFEPESRLKSIGDGAFSSCHKLRGITIPALVNEISGNPFHRSRAMDVSIDANNTHFIVDGPVLMTSDRMRLISCFASITSFQVPSSVKVIGTKCFTCLNQLQVVTFENGSQCSQIKKQAFFESALRRITIPASVEKIHGEAFARCEVKELTIDPMNQHFEVFGPLIMTCDKERIVCCFRSDLSFEIPPTVNVLGKYCFSWRESKEIEKALAVMHCVSHTEKNAFSDCSHRICEIACRRGCNNLPSGRRHHLKKNTKRKSRHHYNLLSTKVKKSSLILWLLDEGSVHFKSTEGKIPSE